METHKKIWQKPQLVILGRGRPEERVLAFCKYTGNRVGPYDPTQNPTGKCASKIQYECKNTTES